MVILSYRSAFNQKINQDYSLAIPKRHFPEVSARYCLAMETVSNPTSLLCFWVLEIDPNSSRVLIWFKKITKSINRIRYSHHSKLLVNVRTFYEPFCSKLSHFEIEVNSMIEASIFYDQFDCLINHATNRYLQGWAGAKTCLIDQPSSSMENLFAYAIFREFIYL